MVQETSSPGALDHNPQKIEQNVKWRAICELETSSQAQGYGVAMQHGHKCF